MTEELEGKTNKPETARERRESQQHQDNVAIADAINRVTEQLLTDEEEQKRSDNQGAGRERLTIILLFLTVIFTAGADLIFNQTMLEAKLATIDAHEDSRLAIERASWAAWDAVYAAHEDATVAVRSAKLASDAALRRADIANKQVRAEQRPWVYATEVIPAGKISQEGAFYVMSLKISIKNTGKSPAFFVIEKTKATVITMAQSTKTIKNDICDEYRKALPIDSAGDTVFPDQVITHGGFESETYPAVDLLDWYDARKDRLIVLYGCIDYQFPDQPGHHQSRFAFLVGKPFDQNGLARVESLPNDPTSVDIRLMPVNIGNEQAPD